MREQVNTTVNIHQIVSRDPEVHSGDLVFAGTRVPVDTLVDYLKGGSPLDEFLEDFPTVERWQAESFLDLSPHAIDQLRAESAHSA